MAQVDSENTPVRSAFPPPRPLTRQQRADAMLILYRMQRAAGIPADQRLDPKDVLADLFEELLVQNPDEMASMVILRLIDAGFRIVPASSEDQA